MKPMKTLRLSLGEALAADATSLAPAADANEIALIAADFVEDETLVIGDLTLATFTGSDPISGATGTQLAGIDPLTGEQVITIKEPAGGYRWECTADPVAPEEIFGYALTTKDGVALLAVKRFEETITITEAGQQIDIGNATLRMVLEPLS